MYVDESPDGVRTYQNVDLGSDCAPLRTKHITLSPPTSKVPEFSSMGSFADKSSFAGESGESTITSSLDFEASTDRLKILQDELKSEESKLAELEPQFNNGAPSRLADETDDRVYQARTENLRKQIEQTKDNIRILKKDIEDLLN